MYNHQTPSVHFDMLPKADLRVGTIYRSGTAGNYGDDPISKVIGGGNQGGFRFEGQASVPGVKFIVLYTTLREPEWPDAFEDDGHTFVYYGDNRKPGKDLHDTPKRGNIILRDLYGALHENRRSDLPPIFVFSRWQKSRDVLFRGLAVPGAGENSQRDDLVVLKSIKEGNRFQNYRATFTMLESDVVSRKTINEIKAGRWKTVALPEWRAWAGQTK